MKKDKSRGFSQLEGALILHINARAINSVIIEDTDGHTYEIEADIGPLNIPIIKLTKIIKE